MAVFTSGRRITSASKRRKARVEQSATRGPIQTEDELEPLGALHDEVATIEKEARRHVKDASQLVDGADADTPAVDLERVHSRVGAVGDEAETLAQFLAGHPPELANLLDAMAYAGEERGKAFKACFCAIYVKVSIGGRGNGGGGIVSHDHVLLCDMHEVNVRQAPDSGKRKVTRGSKIILPLRYGTVSLPYIGSAQVEVLRLLFQHEQVVLVRLIEEVLAWRESLHRPPTGVERSEDLPEFPEADDRHVLAVDADVQGVPERGVPFVALQNIVEVEVEGLRGNGKNPQQGVGIE